MNRFSCAGCQSCYIGETKCHLPTKIKKQPQTDAKSHIPQHLNESPNCRDLCDTSCLIIIDQASSSLRIILKEALHITWLKAMLNKQKNHVILTKFRYNVRYLVSQHFRLFTSFVLLITIYFIIHFKHVLSSFYCFCIFELFCNCCTNQLHKNNFNIADIYFNQQVMVVW